MTRIALCIVALLVGADAFAVTFVGNPKFKMTVGDLAGDLDSGAVDLDAITLHRCDGTDNTETIDVTIDPVAGWLSTSTLPEGVNFCGLTATWGSPMFLYGDNAGGDVEVAYLESSTYVPFNAPPTVALDPHTFALGSLPAGGPTLTLSLVPVP